MTGLSVRLKFIGISLLLCVALVSVFCAAAGTVRAYQNLAKDQKQVMARDLSTIRPWMTLPYVAHVYQIPEHCLDQSLHISNPLLTHHATLRFIADYSRRPVDSVIAEVRLVIQRYRDQQLVCPAPAIPRLPPSRHPPSEDERGASL